MQNFVQDLRYSARMLTTHPGLAITAALAIGLGIGLPTTMFSIVNGALADLPFEQSQRLVSISRMNPSFNWDRAGVPLSEFLDWQQQQTSFAAMGIEMTEQFNVSGSDGRAERFKGAVVSVNASVIREETICLMAGSSPIKLMVGLLFSQLRASWGMGPNGGGVRGKSPAWSLLPGDDQLPRSSRTWT